MAACGCSLRNTEFGVGLLVCRERGQARWYLVVRSFDVPPAHSKGYIIAFNSATRTLLDRNSRCLSASILCNPLACVLSRGNHNYREFVDITTPSGISRSRRSGR